MHLKRKQITSSESMNSLLVWSLCKTLKWRRLHNSLAETDHRVSNLNVWRGKINNNYDLFINQQSTASSMNLCTYIMCIIILMYIHKHILRYL